MGYQFFVEYGIHFFVIPYSFFYRNDNFYIEKIILHRDKFCSSNYFTYLCIAHLTRHNFMKHDECFETISKYTNEKKIELIKTAISFWKFPNKFYYHSPNDDEFNDNHVDDLNEINFINGEQDYDFPNYVRLDDNNKLYYVSIEGNEYDEQQLIHQEDEMLTSLARLCFDCDFITMNQKIEIA